MVEGEVINNTPRLFISYSTNDVSFADPLERKLVKKYGRQNVWKAHLLRDASGEEWWKSILLEIAKADIFLYLLSEDSWMSPHCQDEWKTAIELDKPVIPIKFHPKFQSPIEFEHIQVLELYNPENRSALQSLYQSIGRQWNKLKETSVPNRTGTDELELTVWSKDPILAALFGDEIACLNGIRALSASVDSNPHAQVVRKWVEELDKYGEENARAKVKEQEALGTAFDPIDWERRAELNKPPRPPFVNLLIGLLHDESDLVVTETLQLIATLKLFQAIPSLSYLTCHTIIDRPSLMGEFISQVDSNIKDKDIPEQRLIFERLLSQRVIKLNSDISHMEDWFKRLGIITDPDKML